MKRSLRGWLFFIASLTLVVAQAQTLSPSKISLHLINNYTSGSSNVVSGKPRILKVLGLDSGFPSGMVQALRDYKAGVPGGKTVVRIYSAKNYSLSDNATASAGDFWANTLQAGLNHLSASDRALIDYLEGPNEGQTPTLGYPNTAPDQASAWFNQFWTNLTPMLVAAGYKPCIGSIAVGNPGGSTAQMQSYLAAFVPALRQAKVAGGAWSYHAYTINYTTDPNDEFYYSLRYRQFYSYFASAFPDLATMPLLLTEGGVDQSGDPATSGWQARGSAGNFQRWLNWFDQQMQQDTYLLGCTLFENGDPAGWSSFELEPITGWLKNYLLAPAAVPPPPSNVVVSVTGPGVTLSWTNPPLNPTTWSVKRSTNSAGPFFTVATNVNSGVPATSYTDTSATNLATYFYVVTAVNAAGEGAASAPVTVTLLPPSALNCGGPAIGLFANDFWFDAGTAYATSTAINTNGISNPAPMAVYQSQRYGNLTYTLPYLGAFVSYKVRLHFAEVYWTSPGQRVFNVLLNGAAVLSNFDIVSAAGGSFKANVQELNAISDSTGRITIQLVSLIDNAAINGLELIPNPTNSVPVAPTNLAATVGNALVTVTWNAPSGATRFSLKRSTTSGANYAVIASNLNQTLYRDPSFSPNATYYYVVSALNALGESPNSAQVSARPTNGLPDVVVTSVTWFPPTLFNGSHAIFSARVLNRGSIATPQGTTLGVGFNVDNAGTASWSSSYSAALSPNASVTLMADGGPASVNYWSASHGPHFVTATVDDINRFPESIEDNNAFTASFTVFTSGYSINSGGPAVGTFTADANYAGSANTFAVTNTIDTSGAPNAAPAAVYQTERWGEFAYLFPNLVPGSNYTVRLHFAEISTSVTNAGDRRFHIAINGVRVFTDFDILAQSVTKFHALTREVKMRADSSGSLLVQFIAGTSNQPKCSGLEVIGSSRPVAPLLLAPAVTNDLAIVSWQTVTGGIYQVQYKNDLSTTNWFPVGGNNVANGTSLSITNENSGAVQRYYRVILID